MGALLRRIRRWLMPSTADFADEVNRRVATLDYSQHDKVIARNANGKELFTIRVGPADWTYGGGIF